MLFFWLWHSPEKFFPQLHACVRFPFQLQRADKTGSETFHIQACYCFPDCWFFCQSRNHKTAHKKHADKTHAAKAQITSLFFFIFSFLLSFYTFYIPKYSLIWQSVYSAIFWPASHAWYHFAVLTTASSTCQRGFQPSRFRIQEQSSLRNLPHEDLPDRDFPMLPRFPMLCRTGLQVPRWSDSFCHLVLHYKILPSGCPDTVLPRSEDTRPMVPVHADMVW